ncbi:MAG TPA: hypothetical protein VFS43_36590 [Polyangiaceae bacterium]|nr:hypothetical protein [Polyangiaceae bacterium]
MTKRDKRQPDPLTGGRGRADEVDQSKGIFPPGVPHPEGADVLPPGALGGGPYEESGRGGAYFAPDLPAGGARRPERAAAKADRETGADERAAAKADGETGAGERAAAKAEPVGELPPHR